MVSTEEARIFNYAVLDFILHLLAINYEIRLILNYITVQQLDKFRLIFAILVSISIISIFCC